MKGRSPEVIAAAAAIAISLCTCSGTTVAEKSGVVVDRVPPLAYPVMADLNAMVNYRGMNVTPPVAHLGQPLKLLHVWEVMAPPGAGWKVMTRLRGQGQLEIVADHDAARGLYPVAQWQRGDIVRDEQEVTLPPSWTAPTVTVLVGLMNGPARLPIVVGPRQDENHIIAATIRVDLAPTVHP
jgi:hypothetical protein